MTSNVDVFNLIHVPSLDVSHVEVAWHDVEDCLAVLLRNCSRQLGLLHEAHAAGIQHPLLLLSLTCLISPPDETCYTASLETVAAVLVHPRRHISALACVRCLWKALHPQFECVLDSVEEDNRNEQLLKDLLLFLLGGRLEPIGLDDLVWWELRSQCQQLLRQNQQERREQVEYGADQVERWLRTGARTVETGLSASTQFVTDCVLEPAGGLVCDFIEPKEASSEREEEEKESIEDIDSRRAEVVRRTYVNTAKRATGSTCATARRAVVGIRDASRRGLATVAQSLPADQIVQDEDSRVLLKAASTVGLASLGAATIVGEAVIASTKQIAHTSAKVTAQVVQHKYGSEAGQMVRDVADTAGNILETVGYVGLLSGKAITKMAAKDTSKARLVGQLEGF